MIYRLQRKEYGRVRPLFEGAHSSLVIDAVIAGNTPGRVWVDDRRHPGAAFLWDRAHGYYLVGRADDDAFNGALARLIDGAIVPSALDQNLSAFKIHYTSEGWEPKIGELLGDRRSIKRRRTFFALKRLNVVDWRDRIPPSFSMARIDEQLLGNASLKNVGRVVDEIRSCWYGIDDFLGDGFGFCLIHGDEIVCWCTAEYVSKGKCGIGIETIEKYQGRGFATLAASAFAEHCLAHHIVPHWDSWGTNLASVRVAEKVGFERVCAYEVYFGWFTPFDSRLVNGARP